MQECLRCNDRLAYVYMLVVLHISSDREKFIDRNAQNTYKMHELPAYWYIVRTL